MASHIPFVQSGRDCNILQQFYSDSKIVRVSLESIHNVQGKLPESVGLWMDPSVDGYNYRLTTKWPTSKPRRDWKPGLQQLWNKWENVFQKFTEFQILADKNSWRQSCYEKLRSFVYEVLNECFRHRPVWITVPQLPIVSDGSRNRINRMLADATKEWKISSCYRGKLILPLVFTLQKQLNSKPIRDKKLNVARDCWERATADGVWVVDTSVVDQQRNENFPKRYLKLIEFHKLLRKELPKDTTIVAGPYWGINLVLWAQGLCDYPAITLGTKYGYYISCGRPQTGSIRLAIPPLRRRAVTQGLKSWLPKAIDKLSPTDPAHRELENLRSNFGVLTNREAAINQVARFYKKWFDEIETIPPASRALGLYQDLSSAFVIGRQLPKLPRDTLPHCSASAREAGKVAEQLMLQCL